MKKLSCCFDKKLLTIIFLFISLLYSEKISAQILYMPDTLSGKASNDEQKSEIEKLENQVQDCEKKIRSLLEDSIDLAKSYEQLDNNYKKEIIFLKEKIIKDSVIYAGNIQQLDSLQNDYDSCFFNLQEEEEYNAQLLVAIQDLLAQNEGLRESLKDGQKEILSFEARLLELSNLRDTLSALNLAYKQELDEKQNLLEEQIKVLQQKEQLFSEKELLYKEAIGNSNVDKVKLEGQINVKNEKIQSKEKEINYLQKQIEDKEKNLSTQQENLKQIVDERNKYLLLADTLRENLVKTEKELLKIKEELKYTEQRAKEAEAKIAQATNRKKKVRVIQGLAMKLYRTPDWDIKPESIEGGYQNVIINRNAGDIEFDFITGASVMLYDFTKNKSRYTYDLGLYVGFGGSNLFKNFYVGPSFKFLDFFHFSTGVNIAEYQILAKGLSEGDTLPPGWQIQTVKQWKANFFISLSLDLEFIGYIGKK